MAAERLLIQARGAAGLSQVALAQAAGTSRPTLAPKVAFVERAVDRGRPIMVSTSLPRLSLDDAFSVVELRCT